MLTALILRVIAVNRPMLLLWFSQLRDKNRSTHEKKYDSCNDYCEVAPI